MFCYFNVECSLKYAHKWQYKNYDRVFKYRNIKWNNLCFTLMINISMIHFLSANNKLEVISSFYYLNL